MVDACLDKRSYCRDKCLEDLGNRLRDGKEELHGGEQDKGEERWEHVAHCLDNRRDGLDKGGDNERQRFYESGEQLHGTLYELWQKGDEHFDEARNEVGELLKKQRQYLDERLSKRHEELKACFEEDRHALD